MKTRRWFTNSSPVRSHLRIVIAGAFVLASGAMAFVALRPSSAFAAQSAPTYNINTLAGKVASLRGTAGLQIRFSAFIEQEAEEPDAIPPTSPPITPTYVLSSPLDGTTIVAPDVLVNQDIAAAPQNETAIAVDPNNPNRIVGGANDYVTRTWSCFVGITPCSALGDGYSGTYYSNNGGSSWCCNSNPNSNYTPTTDPSQIGTLIPGVERLVGGIYDAGGDPSVAFDSQGHVFYAGLGFNRTSPPNTVAVNKGTFDGGNLTWGQPTFINQTTSPSTLNDKPWIAVDSHTTSPFKDRIYVTWTRFIFNANNGHYVQSPIAFVSSSDGGATFTTPKLISGNVVYGQGSHPVVGPDGTLYVFWDASTRLASFDSTWMVKSTDGGATWSNPLAVAPLIDSSPLHDTAFRVNSYPAAAAAPNGDLYATWTTVISGASTTVYSKSTDGGATWSATTRVFTAGNRTAIGYPVTNPDGTTLNAPSPTGPIEDIFPAVSVGADGHVHLGAYRGTVVSPWQTCAAGPPPPEGRINCTTLGNYIHNTRLDYVVHDLSGGTNPVTTQHINTRYGFGGGFFGDYTDIAAGSNNVLHAFWTDSNNEQSVVWFYGLQFVPTLIHQQDVVIGVGP
jgi:BNR repeat-like domain